MGVERTQPGQRLTSDRRLFEFGVMPCDSQYVEIEFIPADKAPEGEAIDVNKLCFVFRKQTTPDTHPSRFGV